MATLNIPQFTDKKLVTLNVNDIMPNPLGTRKNFDEYELMILAESIKQNGLIQPITVRKNSLGMYELISGERRLKACKMAGIGKVSCIVQRADKLSGAVYGVLENLQHSSLTIFEEAAGIKRLMDVFGMSQCEIAAQLGIAPATLSNKLRLLRLSESQQNRIVLADLSERHAKALVRLPEDERDAALDVIISKQLALNEAEDYIAKSVSPEPQKAPPVRKTSVNDVKLFANSLNKIVNTMVRSGFPAKTEKIETDSYIEYTVRISKTETDASQLKIIM
ncbi:MAG: ParB/RepB/Spo0J family partition protein [Clostridia bacterium]|nr:ParB/RepB/Spo0J family partition protein [Clostridia bacterium]